MRNLPALLPFLALVAAPVHAKPAPKKAPEPPPAPVVAPVPAPEPPPLPAWAKDVQAAMKPGANACQDFYQYACGGWIDATPLPADKPSYGRSFNRIFDDNLATLRSVLETAAATPGADATSQKIGAFYGSCMDDGAADKAGLSPLAPLMDRIATVKNLATFMAVAGELSLVGVNVPVDGEIDADFKDPSVQVLYMVQGGLSLPDRDYYLKGDEGSLKQQAALETAITAQLARAGLIDAAGLAKEVVALERALAEQSVPRTDLHDPEKLYRPVDRKGLLKAAPKLKLDQWLAGAGIPAADRFSVGTPTAFVGFQDVLKKAKPEVLRAYLTWQTIHAFAGALDTQTYTTDFELYGKVLRGQQKPEDRWKRCVRSTDGAMGDLLGKAYVDQRFAGESKTIAVDMITGIEGAFRAGLPKLAWMDDATRAAANGKVDTIVNKIGYPDALRTYEGLQVKAGDYAGNVAAARRFEATRQLAKVGQPTDRAEWFMSPPTVNAYYNPTMNEIAFPAGILQPPFFSKEFPAAMNYGAIGMVMGHEITHGFDDSGSKFDALGRMQAWWPAEVTQRFEERTTCVKNQYDAYEVAPGLKVNGELTLGENIADIGGSRIAYGAFKAAQAAGKVPPAGMPGLSDDQLFFVALAQSWCSVSSPEYEKMRVLSDPHSPNRFRVNGTLANVPEFAAAFGCEEGTPMRPKNACEVW